MKPLAWFRCHSDIVDDDKLGLLAFEDRWHFIAILACKAKGLLDESDEFMRRKVQRKLGLTMDEFEKAVERLARVKLIDKDTLEPLAWDKRQFASDGSTDRVRAYRERVKRFSNVSETPSETETETETEKTKTNTGTRFARPDVQQVADYIAEIGATVNPAAWMDHYTANGWKVGKNPMRDWRACVRTWARGKNNERAGDRFGRNSGEDRSAAGRVRANVARDRAARAAAGAGRDDLATDGLDVRPSVVELVR